MTRRSKKKSLYHDNSIERTQDCEICPWFRRSEAENQPDYCYWGRHRKTVFIPIEIGVPPNFMESHVLSVSYGKLRKCAKFGKCRPMGAVAFPAPTEGGERDG